MDKLLKALPHFINWPVFYRLVRTAFVTAVAETWAMGIDWTNPDQAIKAAVVSIAAGFLVALGKGIRDAWGHSDVKKGFINRLLPI